MRIQPDDKPLRDPKYAISHNAAEIAENVLIALTILGVVALVAGMIFALNADANDNRKHFRESCVRSGGTVIIEEVSDHLVTNCKAAG